MKSVGEGDICNNFLNKKKKKNMKVFKRLARKLKHKTRLFSFIYLIYKDYKKEFHQAIF